MSAHTRGCGANCRCDFVSQLCRICNCGADARAAAAGLSPQEFVAAVARGEYRIGQSRGRIVLRVADTTAAQVIDGVWKRLVDVASRQLFEALR